MDERYLIHRLRSTSLAGVIGAVSIGVWIMFQLITKNIIRWDLFIILLIMAVVKISTMIYYKLTN